MRLAWLVIVILFSFPRCEAKSHKPRFQYDLSVVAMFRDEAPFLKEWIEYHHMLGVDHFYLYNNSSSDNYQEVLAPYIQAKIVELKDWPSPTHLEWTEYQKAAYNNCIAYCKKKTNWLAMIDIDEYIVPHHTNSLKTFLKPYNKMKGIAGVVINWQMFGTSGVWEIPDDMLMTECLIQKAVKKWHHNQNQKSIVKPRFCNGNWIHYGNFITGYRHTLSLNAGPWPHIDEIQVNHYWLRNEKYMREVKAPRRARLEGGIWSEATIQSLINETSTDVDLSIQRFIPQLKQRVKKP